MENWIWDFLGNEGSAEYAQWLIQWLKEIYRAVYRLPTVTLLSPGSRLFWVYLIAFIMVAALSFALYYRRPAYGFRNFLKFCFPKAVYLHRSAMVDYQLFIVNIALSPITRLAPILSTVAVAAMVGDQLAAALGPREQLFATALWTNVAVTIAFLLVWDFATYVNHAAHHFIPVLWPFHSVHHSAEVLTPITIYRSHPLYGVVKGSVRGVIMGLFQGVIFYFFFGEVALVTILGVNFGVVLFNFAGSNLRHSHMWLSFGPWLSYVFMSPAQHQIHHSVAPEHRNKNLGRIFAIWDWMFGTLYVPMERLELVFGIGDGRAQPHSNLLAVFAVPFLDSWGAIRQAIGGRGN